MSRARPAWASSRSQSRGAEHRAALLAIYAEVDTLLVTSACDATTECCRFGVSGREPYPTAAEIAEIDRAIASSGGERAVTGTGSRGTSKRRALPIADGERGEQAQKNERRCPFLSEAGRCRIYTARPFGCRTFFCERRTGPGKLPRAEIQRLARAIADLSARAFPEDPRARPLTRVFLQPT